LISTGISTPAARLDEQIHLQTVAGPEVVKWRLFTPAEIEFDRLLSTEILEQVPGHGAVEEMRLIPNSGQVTAMQF
jgi:hypothetical protein